MREFSQTNMLAIRCIEREDKECHESYVTEREKDDRSWDSNHTPSAIWGDVLSHLNYKRHLILI